MSLSMLLVAFSLFAPQGPSSAPVVINEISHDDAGTIDDRDFVELWNRTAAPIDLSNWTLQGEEGSLGGNSNGAFIFPVGTIIGPGQYLVIGQANVPNVNLVVTATNPPEWLGENVAGSANLPDGVTLRNDVGAIIDTVVWNYAAWAAAPPPWIEGTGLWGSMQLLDSGTQPQGFMTAQRWIDGYDSNDNGADFVAMQWTPGAANGSNNTLLPAIVENCDAGPGATLAALFANSFVPATIQDPAAVLVATGTTRVFPPSPQGGNVARIQDPTGGGNMVALQTVPVLGSLLFECFAYVVPGNPALLAGEGESWAIGVRGTTDAFAHPVDAPGTYYAQTSLCSTNHAPGATGVAWMAYVAASRTELFLVDANNGGPGFTVLAGPIVCDATANSGWQRLRLRIDGTSLVANFGGTFGADDGQRFTATVAAGHGTPWLQYRECIVANANMTGFLVDRIEVYTPVAGTVTFAGTPSPTTTGLPAIATAGAPTIGSSGFQITATGMIPFGVSLLALDVGALLPGVPVPGAPPALALYATPTFVATVLNTPAGTSAFTFPLPAANAIAGTPLAAQWFDLDVALPFALPFGSSRGCQIVVGN